MARTVTGSEDQLWRVLSPALGSEGYCNGISGSVFLLRLERGLAQRVHEALAYLAAGGGNADDLRARARRVAVSRGSGDRRLVLSVRCDSASGIGVVTSRIYILSFGGMCRDWSQHDRSVRQRTLLYREGTGK
jgi:hypothetical protein